MENCIFCKIVNKEIPSYTVYEDENFLAFLDIHPQSPGHVQVIPKKHYRWVWDLPSEVLQNESLKGGPTIQKYFTIVHKIALAQQKAFDTEMILCRITGEEISHAHIWIFPALSADRPNSKIKGNPKDFSGNAEKIKKFLSN